MIKIEGKKINGGIAIGKVLYYEAVRGDVEQKTVQDPAAEKERYLAARRKAISQLDDIYQKALKKVGEENAQIFQVHAMMLEDDDFNDAIFDRILSKKMNAEYAVSVTGDQFAEMFASMDDAYFKARSADIRDISKRVIAILSGQENDPADLTEPVILVAEDLAPSETVQMDKEKLLAFATRLGSANSHTAILARTMNIPALVGIAPGKECTGQMGIVDGDTGVMILDPDPETLAMYQKKFEEDRKQREMLQALKGLPNETKSGRSVKLFANIGNVSDLPAVLNNDAGGIGLFRSEFLYLSKTDFPTEDEQFAAYKQVLETMQGKKVVIRTLDIGADKQVDYFHLGHEDNPAMGYRAIRICLTQTDIFKTQLRALLRAAVYGNLSVMYPMITSTDEVKEILRIVEETRQELQAQGIACGEIEQGIMVETPAAALVSDELAKLVSFFSIGTNDLTQYTLAIDRQNTRLDHFYQPHHEAVLKLIEMTVKNGHAAGIWVGICGELGADTTLTKRFLEMGVDELSVSAGKVLSVRKAIRELD